MSQMQFSSACHLMVKTSKRHNATSFSKVMMKEVSCGIPSQRAKMVTNSLQIQIYSLHLTGWARLKKRSKSMEHWKR